MNVYCDDEFCVLDTKIIWGSLTFTYFSSNWYYSKFCLWQLEKEPSHNTAAVSLIERKKKETRLARHYLHGLTILSEWLQFGIVILLLCRDTNLKNISLNLMQQKKVSSPDWGTYTDLRKVILCTILWGLNLVRLQRWKALPPPTNQLCPQPGTQTLLQDGYLGWEDLLLFVWLEVTCVWSVLSQQHHLISTPPK